MSQGNLYILSAPSGAGKSSLISALLEKNQGMKKMVVIKRIISISKNTKEVIF